MKNINKQLGIKEYKSYRAGLESTMPQLATEDWSLDFYNDKGFSNATGRETELITAIKNAKSKLATLNSNVATYTKRIGEWKSYAGKYLGFTHSDWKNRKKKGRSEFIALCKTGNCSNQGKTGYGGRYNSRYDTWLKALAGQKRYEKLKSDTLKTAIPSQKKVITASEKALKDYRDALNDKIAQGHTPESASQFALNEIQAQTEAINNAQTVADAQASAIESSGKENLIKIAIVGSALIIGLVIFLRFRKK